MKALVGAFNQEKALVGAFSVIVQPVGSFYSTKQDSISGARRGSLSLTNFKQLTPLCVLFPVLGIQFFLVPARPEHKSKYEYSYDLMLTISSSFQG